LITASFTGYVIWLCTLALLWTFLLAISTCPILYFCFHCGPCFYLFRSSSNGKALKTAKFKEGCSVAFLSVCRIVHIALIVTLTFLREAPTFACVEFSFRHKEQDNAYNYSSPLFSMIEAIFYPTFMLAGKTQHFF
jgi:hypothetical protein